MQELAYEEKRNDTTQGDEDAVKESGHGTLRHTLVCGKPVLAEHEIHDW